MKRVVCFCIPVLLLRRYKTHIEFHKYRMKSKFILDSFYHMINSKKRRSVTYNVKEELRSISLSKFFPVLCHTLIYEMVIFYSIKLESCNI